jgi:signal transduction histidine kinase
MPDPPSRHHAPPVQSDPPPEGDSTTATPEHGARQSVSLRARFYVLLALLAGMALAPAAVSEQSHRSIDGFATALEESGSLRYRLLQMRMEVAKARTDPEARQHVETMLADQHELLSRTMSGDARSDFAACPTTDLCERFRAHLKRWDTELAPKLRAAMDDPEVAAQVDPKVLLEVNELDLTVRAFARAVQTRTERNAGYGVLASAGSMLLVFLAAIGVWQVFRRIETVRDAAGRSDDRALREDITPADEIGALAASLVHGIESERARRRAERQRSDELRREQRAVRQSTTALSSWLAGKISREDALDQMARATGYSRIALRPGEGPRDPDREPPDHELPLVWETQTLGTLELFGRSGEEPTSDEVLMETLSRIVTIACLADRLLADKTQQSRLVLALSGVSSRPTRSELGTSLLSLLPHDGALLELYDETSRIEDAWLIHRDRVERVATHCDAHAPEAPTIGENACTTLHRHAEGNQLEIPLHLGKRLVGSLNLARKSGDFTAQDLATAEALAPIIAGALGRIQLEGRLRFAEQWSTLGAFGRLLAHEIKNPLNSLGLELQLLGRRLGKLDVPDEQREKLTGSLAVVKNELKRLTALTTDYLSISPRSGDMTVEPVDLRDVAAEVARAHAAAMSERQIALSEDLGAEPAVVEGNSGRLKQLLHNLVGNAMDAVADGERRELSIRIVKHGREIRLSVRDTGPGLSDPVAIFEPGYSTKPSGTGMGLAISQQIARQHGGRLVARALPEGGSEFTLVISGRLEQADTAAN